MLTRDAIDHFGSKSAIARKLRIGKAAVSKWGEFVPPLRAAQLHALTRGRLKFNPDAPAYRDWYGKSSREVAA